MYGWHNALAAAEGSTAAHVSVTLSSLVLAQVADNQAVHCREQQASGGRGGGRDGGNGVVEGPGVEWP